MTITTIKTITRSGIADVSAVVFLPVAILVVLMFQSLNLLLSLKNKWAVLSTVQPICSL